MEKPAQGYDCLTDDPYIQVATLDELYGLPPAEFVKASYRALLDREADHEGLSHYLTRMALGDSRLCVLRSMVKSKEYRLLASCSDLRELGDDAFIEIGYRRILGRAIDDAGRLHYLDQLGSGKSRASVLKSLARSPEARMGMQPLLRLRRQIEAALSSHWRPFGRGQSSRRLAQLDFALSAAVHRTHADLQRQITDLRDKVGERHHALAGVPIDSQAGNSETRRRWVPRDLRTNAALVSVGHENRAVPAHADYENLSKRMRQEAPFGRLKNSQEGRQYFNDYLEADYGIEYHDGDAVRWIASEAAAYLRVTGERFHVEASGFFEHRSVMVLFDNFFVGTLRFGKEMSISSLATNDWMGKDVTIRFKCSGTINPAAAGLNSDRRNLGLLIRSIYFD